MTGIYIIISPRGQVYIGQSWDIERRFYDHKHLKHSVKSLLYHSLINYGIKNHVFEIIHELPGDVEQEVLDRYEKLYWELYKDCGIPTLNSCVPTSSKKAGYPVYQYSSYGIFIKEWPSATEAARILNLNSKAIRDCVKGLSKTSGNFIWLNYYEPVVKEYKYKNYILKVN